MLYIKKMLWNFVQKFHEKEIFELICSDRIRFQKDKEEREQFYQQMELEHFVGKPIITISNEWETPTIGFAKSVMSITKANTPVLLIQSYLDGQEYIVLGKCFVYTEQRFDALFKINPFELCSFIYDSYIEVFDKPKYQQLLDKEEVIELLKAHGFYERLEEYEKSRLEPAY